MKKTAIARIEKTDLNEIHQNSKGDQKLISTVNTYLKNFLSDHTRSAYQSDFREFASFLSQITGPLGHPKNITKDHVISYRDHLRNQRFSPNTINRKMSALNSLFKELSDERIIDKNPVEGLKRPPATTLKPTKGFSDEETRKILKHYKKDTVENLKKKTLLHTLFYTGCRESELIEIQVKDVDFKGPVPVLKLHGKGSKVRLLPLHPHLSPLIEELILRSEKQPQNPLFSTKNGQKLYRNYIYRLIKRTCLACDLPPDRSPHSTRATTISNLRENGADIEDVAKIAGHSKIDTTAGYNVRDAPIEENVLLDLSFRRRKRTAEE